MRTLGRQMEKIQKSGKIIYQHNSHAILLIFGLLVAVYELLTYIDYFFHLHAHWAVTLKKAKNYAKNYIAA